MPEHQSRCEFQRGSLEIGLGPAGEEHRGPEGGVGAVGPEDSGVSTQHQQPWQAAREAGGAACPPGLHVMVIVLIPASGADRRQRRWLRCGCLRCGCRWGGLGVAGALPPPLHRADVGVA